MTRLVSGGGQFRRQSGERLDERHNLRKENEVGGGANVVKDAGGVFIAPRINLIQQPIFIVELPPSHPFRIRPASKTTVTVEAGKAMLLEGSSTTSGFDYVPLVVDVDAQTVSVSQAGGIWAEFQASVIQQSTSKTGDVRLYVYVIDDLSFIGMTHETTDFTPDYAASNRLAAGSTLVFRYKIGTVKMVQNRPYPEEQIIRDNIEVPRVLDAEIVASTP